jgi:DEAD/DEAH box helicase domain-containing protein
MDTLVFDVETSNFFNDPAVGWHNYDALRISAVGVYSYAQDKYLCYDEHQLGELKELMRNAGLIVGFSINRYDVPVLNVAFQKLTDTPHLNLFQKDRLDLLDEIELVAGRRISLHRLALANLGVGKESNGAAAIELYRAGKIEELKAYCLKDVELTKKLYDIYRTQHSFMITDKETNEAHRIQFGRSENLPAPEAAAAN